MLLLVHGFVGRWKRGGGAAAQVSTTFHVCIHTGKRHDFLLTVAMAFFSEYLTIFPRPRAASNKNKKLAHYPIPAHAPPHPSPPHPYNPVRLVSHHHVHNNALASPLSTPSLSDPLPPRHQRRHTWTSQIKPGCRCQQRPCGHRGRKHHCTVHTERKHHASNSKSRHGR